MRKGYAVLAHLGSLRTALALMALLGAVVLAGSVASEVSPLIVSRYRSQ